MKSLEEGDNLVTCNISTPLYSAEQTLAETSHQEPPGYWFLNLSWSIVVCWEVEKLSTWKNPCQDCCNKKYSLFIPIKISSHSNLVITNYETRGEQLIGNTISRILMLIWSLNIIVVEVDLTYICWFELESDVVEFSPGVPHPQHQVDCSLILRNIFILNLNTNHDSQDPAAGAFSHLLDFVWVLSSCPENE